MQSEEGPLSISEDCMHFYVQYGPGPAHQSGFAVQYLVLSTPPALHVGMCRLAFLPGPRVTMVLDSFCPICMQHVSRRRQVCQGQPTTNRERATDHGSGSDQTRATSRERESFGSRRRLLCHLLETVPFHGLSRV